MYDVLNGFTVKIFLCVLKSISYLRNFGNAADGIRLVEVFVVFIVLFLYFVACSFFLDKVLSKLLSSFASTKGASVFALLKVLLLKVWNKYWEWIITDKYYILHEDKFNGFIFSFCIYLPFEGERYFSWTARSLLRRDAYDVGITFANWFVFLVTLPMSP